MEPLLKSETPGIDNLLRKMEKVELAMLDWNNGIKKLDPVQSYYANLILSIK